MDARIGANERPSKARIRRALAQHALLLEQREDALRALEQGQRRGVVIVRHVDPRDALLCIPLLLLSEHDVDEERLKLLVGEVNAQLLEAI